MSVVLHDVCKVFHKGSADERRAIDGISLRLEEGDFTVVIGSNGAGKSTLLQLLSGALAPDSGRIEIDGSMVQGQPEHVRARLFARVVQDPMRGTLPSMSIEENLALADLRHRGRGLRQALNRARRDRFAAVLASFGLGLEDRLAVRAGLLSGGQRQVLALAMAVLNPPRVLLLDEHTAALDPRTAELVMQATLKAVHGARLTAVMVTHNMQQAIDYGNRLVMLDAGRIRLDIAGGVKQAQSVDELVRRFRMADDKMLLAEP